MEKVVLAYSGGLDTSVILKWLLEKGYEVIAYIGDVGQAEDFEAAKAKALKIGASEVHIEDLKEEFVRDYIFPMIRGGAIYEGRYLLGTSLARPVIAKAHVEVARRVGATIVSHGATGKGNDQVRFELGYYALMPEVKVLAPWKMEEFLSQFKGRTDLLDYCDKYGIEVEATRSKPYSMDANLMHISYEAGVLEDPAARPPVGMYKMTVSPQEAPDKTTSLKISFDKGTPVRVENLADGTVKSEPLEMFNYLNKIAGENGVGRIDVVENRYVGIKSRGCYETPAGTVLWKAHQDLETISMDREVFRMKEQMQPRLAELIYNGYWFSPEMDYLLNSVDKCQEVVTGNVYLDLYKGNVIVVGREAENEAYDANLASMDIEGGYNQKDAEGFIRINAVRLRSSINPWRARFGG
ncbi:MAG: argininosuccinate synthase [bacterium]|nr:argininosuccinate synthase [bacterium]